MYGPCMHGLTIGHYPTSGKTGYIDKTKFGTLRSITYLISRLITKKAIKTAGGFSYLTQSS